MVPGTEEQSESATSASNRWMRLTASVDPMSSIYMVPGTEEQSEPDIWHPTDGCDSQYQLQSRWSACQLVYMIAVEINFNVWGIDRHCSHTVRRQHQIIETSESSAESSDSDEARCNTCNKSKPGDCIQCDMCDAWHHQACQPGCDPDNHWHCSKCLD